MLAQGNFEATWQQGNLKFMITLNSYFEKFAFVVDWNLCGYYISDVGCA